METTMYMAPIRGITNCVYRNTYARLFKGYDCAIAPFLTHCNVSGPRHKHLRDLFPERNTVPYELVPQLLTKRAEDFIIACDNMAALGYRTINWNLGCPHKRIRNKLHGAGLLSQPEMVVRILDEVIPRIRVNVSLKVRLGNEDTRELQQLLPRLNDYPIKEIIIHPRTGLQMYEGCVDLDAFEQCLSRTTHHVVYNGDISSLQTFTALQQRFPHITAWMIGRGGIINPFLIEEIQSGNRVPDAERSLRFKMLHDTLFDAYESELSGWAHKGAKMKEYWSYWTQAFENGQRIFRKLNIVNTKDQYVSAVNMFFAQKPCFVV